MSEHLESSLDYSVLVFMIRLERLEEWQNRGECVCVCVFVCVCVQRELRVCEDMVRQSAHVNVIASEAEMKFR